MSSSNLWSPRQHIGKDLAEPEDENAVVEGNMEIVAEMAALGLPSTFVARVETASAKRKSRKKPRPPSTEESSPPEVVDANDDPVLLPTAAAQGNNNSAPADAKFCVRSVKLYTPRDPEFSVGEEEVDNDVPVPVSTSPQEETLQPTGVDVDDSDNTEHRPNFTPGNSSFQATEVEQEVKPKDEDDSLLLLRVDEELDSRGVAGVGVRAEDDGGGGGSGGIIDWEPIWDEQYQCYYFWNSRTGESTWMPPPEFEQFGPTPTLGNSLCEIDTVGTAENTHNVMNGVISNDEVIASKKNGERGRDTSSMEMSSTLAAAICVEMKGQDSDINDSGTASLSAAEAEAETDHEEALTTVVMERRRDSEEEGAHSNQLLLSTVMTTSSRIPSDATEPISSAAGWIENSREVVNSHIRFRDSDDESSDGGAGAGAGMEQDDGFGREGEGEGEEAGGMPNPTQVVGGGEKGGDDEEGNGTGACSPFLCDDYWTSSSITDEENWISSIRVEVAAVKDKHSKNSRIKKRRLKSLSGAEEFDKVRLPGMVEEMSKNLVKYWVQRYSLFAKYDKGVKMDEEGWYSVTPEIIAEHQASRCAAGLVVDAFAGVGGNAIQFALKSYQVIAIDIDPGRIRYARHNAEIYGVAHKIEFIAGDFFQLAPFLKADVVFLSPPWGGPEYLKQERYDLHTMLQPKDGCTLFKAAQSIAPSVALFVPRNVDVNQLQELSWLTSPPLPCEVEKNFVNDKLKAITAYYGDIADRDL